MKLICRVTLSNGSLNMLLCLCVTTEETPEAGLQHTGTSSVYKLAFMGMYEDPVLNVSKQKRTIHQRITTILI